MTSGWARQKFALAVQGGEKRGSSQAAARIKGTSEGHLMGEPSPLHTAPPKKRGPQRLNVTFKVTQEHLVRAELTLTQSIWEATV